MVVVVGRQLLDANASLLRGTDVGGVLWRCACAQAEARLAFTSSTSSHGSSSSGGSNNNNKASEFVSMVSQNLDYVSAPVLLGRLWHNALEQQQQQASSSTSTTTLVTSSSSSSSSPHSQASCSVKRGDTVVVKWNAVDWWPAQVVAVQHCRDGGGGGDGGLQHPCCMAMVEVEYKDEERTRMTMPWPEDDAHLLKVL